MSRSFIVFPFLLSLLLLPACTANQPTRTGLSFPATQRVVVTFQQTKIPPQCRVFSQNLVATPVGQLGKDIQMNIIADAQALGADMILVGLARENLDDDLEEYVFTSYGPKKPYGFQKKWSGWKYGFKDWNDGGELVSFGFAGWNDSTTPYSQGLLIQNLYLTCQLGPTIPGQ